MKSVTEYDLYGDNNGKSYCHTCFLRKKIAGEKCYLDLALV